MPQKLDIEKIPDFTVTGTAAVETAALDVLRWPRIESVWMRVVGTSGTPDIKLEWAGGIDADNFESFDDTSDLVASTDNLSFNKEGWHKYPIGNHLAALVKFRATGVSSNGTTTVSIRVIKREDYE